MSLPEYLELLDWTGRQFKPGKHGAVSKSAPLILERLTLSPEHWLQVVEQFGKHQAANRTTLASRFNVSGSQFLSFTFDSAVCSCMFGWLQAQRRPKFPTALKVQSTATHRY